MSTNGDTDRLNKALELFSEAQEQLKGINLRHYRGHLETRSAIQEARNSAECGVDWTAEALQLSQPLAATG